MFFWANQAIWCRILITKMNPELIILISYYVSCHPKQSIYLILRLTRGWPCHGTCSRQRFRSTRIPSQGRLPVIMVPVAGSASDQHGYHHRDVCRLSAAFLTSHSSCLKHTGPCTLYTTGPVYIDNTAYREGGGGWSTQVR